MSTEDSSPQIHSGDARLCLVSLPSSSTLAVPRSEVEGSLKEFPALTYRLEELLPMDAERMSVCMIGDLLLAVDGQSIADWWRTPTPNEHDKAAGTDLAVSQGSAANQSWPGKGRATCLAVVPRALLIAQTIQRQLASQPHTSSQLCCLIAWSGSLDAVRFDGPKLCQWNWSATRDYVSMARMLSQSQSEATGPSETKPSVPCHVVFVDDDNLDEGISAELSALLTQYGRTWERSTKSKEEWLAEAVADILRGEVAALANFTNGPLAFVDSLAPAGRSLMALACTAAVAVLLLCAALHWRAERYRSEVADTVAEQEQLFRQLFPKQPVPVGILSRLESEHRRLTATKGVGQEVPELVSCLPVMHKFWTGMPIDARYMVEIAHFTPDTIKTLDGNAKSFDDLEKIRRALIDQGFEVPALSARQSSRGVSLRLDGVPLKSTMNAVTKNAAP